MSRRHTLSVLALLSMILFVVVACGGPSKPPADQATPAAAPAEQAKPAVDLAKVMDQHFSKVREIEEAVVRGDLDAAKTPAKWLGENLQASAFPAGSDTYIADMKKSAQAVAAAMTVENAAAATATMVSTCGTCHVGTKVAAKFPDLAAPVMVPGTASHMLMHQYAVDLLNEGLSRPSDDLWKKGAQAMTVAPLADKDLPKDATLKGDVLKAEQRIHELAERAVKATDQGARIAIYGEVIGACASCHGLHGRMWGPGLPKTEKK